MDGEQRVSAQVKQNGATMMDCVTNPEVLVIHKGSKKSHFKEIHNATGVPYEQMLFFDDDPHNCSFGDCS